MRALCLHQATGPQNARLEDVATPQPVAGEVRVRLVAASLNHRELWISRGMYPGMALPTTMGADGAGVIDAVGEGVDKALIGRETVLYPALNWGPDHRFPTSRFGLLGMPGPGTIAEHICAPAENAVEKPAALSFEEAAALPVAGVTAFRALTYAGKLQAGETVLVTGIGGGLASLALLFARAMGAKVFVTSGSEASLARATALGAAGGVNYKDEGWRKTIGKMTGGIDVVIDGAPASSVANYFRALNPGARVVVYGSTGGGAFQVNAPELFLKYVSVVGTAMGDLEDFRAMITFAATHGIKAPVDRSFAFDEAPAALQYLDTAHGFGKVIVRIAP
jgi:zinc-binding alcohol dehydrogenase/oxidoreductase